ncbi:MAG: PEP-CTERM sorting domain-containing protein, partial [Rubrivivax sp.]|nr:PEP-CTERM sorting domain-containing protein [Rubrivivax sp.]
DLDFKHVREKRFKMERSTLEMLGQTTLDGIVRMEVGGLDVDTFVSLLADGNFGYGRLIVGANDVLARVRLVDNRDNGNRAGTGAAEALYLFGIGTNKDGLQIRGGSTLALNGLPAYARIDGTVIDLYSLFGPGETKVAFDDGFLTRPGAFAHGTMLAAVPEPGTWVLLLAGLGLVTVAARRKR